MAADLVSCLCVTRGRVPMLRRAVACFRAQTHSPRELVVVHDEDDAATRQYLEGLREPAIRPVCVPGRPRLGSLRNVAVDAARGDCVAQWDDDDWSAPERLAVQLAAMRAGRFRACVLRRWTMFDALTGEAYLGCDRAWEGSLLAERAALPRYPDLERAEDTAAVEALAKRGELGGVDRPELYIYVHHGGNTWRRVHWRRRMLAGASRLPAAEAARVRATLEGSP